MAGLALVLAAGLAIAPARANAGAGPPTAAAPATPRPAYASVRRVGSWVFVAGQIPRDPVSGQLLQDPDIRAQTRLALANLAAALDEVGAGLADVVKVTVILRSPADIDAMNDTYRQVFRQQPLPVRTTIPGADFGAGPIRIEIDAIAVIAAPRDGP